jgi:branched-chain amino acid transport system permease protein
MAKTFALLVAGLLLAFGLDAFLSEFIDDYVVRIINLCGIAIVLAVSLNVINGLCGQFSLGHAGFMAIGAYVCAWFTTTLRYFDPEVARYVSSDPVIASQWGFLPGLIAGGLVAALAGLIVGIPTLRLKGDYLAIATLGFGEIVRVIITNVPQIGGATGLPGLPPYSTTTWIFGVCAICIIFSVNLQRSTFGRALIAIRENELAAEVMGVNAARLKVMAFIYGAFFAGVAGGLLGHLMQTISPQTFNFMKSIEVIVMLVLGGLGSLTGAIVGAIALTVLPEALRDVETQSGLPGIRMVVYSLILILLMIFRPQGIFGQRELSLKLLRRLIPGGRGKS